MTITASQPGMKFKMAKVTNDEVDQKFIRGRVQVRSQDRALVQEPGKQSIYGIAERRDHEDKKRPPDNT